MERIQRVLAGRTRWYDVIETQGSATPVSFANNRFHSITGRHNRGFGIRVNVEGKTGFSYTNDPAMIEETADRAVALAAYGEAEDFDLPSSAEATFEPYREAIMAFDTKREIAAADEAIASLRDRLPGAVVDASIAASDGSVRLCNSEGLDASYRSSSYSAHLSVTLTGEDGVRLEASESASHLAPAGYGELVEKLAEKIDRAMTTRRLESGRVPVMLTPRAVARIIGIVTAGLNGRAVWRGISPFADRLGQVLFSEHFSLLDDPHLDDSPHSYPFDDEGVTATRKHLVRAGRIETFLTDLAHARRLGLTPGGNGARSYASLPHPSFSNVVIEAGIRGREEMVRGIPRGILVDRFIGLGQSNTLTGDFSAGLELAYLIDGGELAGRVKDCMLSDNLFTLLAGEIEISAERERVGSVLAPWILFPAVSFTG